MSKQMERSVATATTVESEAADEDMGPMLIKKLEVRVMILFIFFYLLYWLLGKRYNYCRHLQTTRCWLLYR